MIKPAFIGLWDWVDKRLVVRRCVLIVTVWMVYQTTVWAQAYAATSERPGTDIALIVGAVSTPLTLLMGYVFKLYSEVRAP